MPPDPGDTRLEKGAYGSAYFGRPPLPCPAEAARAVSPFKLVCGDPA